MGIKDVLITYIFDISYNAHHNIPDNWPVEVINFNGAYLVLGFIDSHDHITDGEADFSKQAPPSFSFKVHPSEYDSRCWTFRYRYLS
jgi:N-acetylglucosamine-6-phosphate deacetylase